MQANIGPLFRRPNSVIVFPEQWIFPSLQFTCEGRVTGWIFRTPQSVNVDVSCRVQLTTWRLNTSSSFFTLYQRVSTTETNLAGTQTNTSFVTYALSSPVQVRPGDVLGIELASSCNTIGRIIGDILTKQVGGSGQSFWRSSRIGSFLVSSAASERDLIPLVRPILGKFCNGTTNTCHMIH